MLGQFVNTQPSLDGRPFLCHRKPEWLALEDKTVIDAFFDRAEVPRADSDVVAADQELLRDASKRLDRGRGVVWSGDAKEGFNGGAEYVFWVHDNESFAVAADFLSSRCDRVRVAPFLEGIPCSIHGLVLPDGVATLRPVEMMTLRRTDANALPGSSLFTYRGCASFYEPGQKLRAAMATAASRVGRLLRSEVDFRGCFTLDGVVTAQGFLPTEVNPRQGAGLFVMLKGLDSIPVSLLMDALGGGVDLGLSASRIEADLTPIADEHPAGGTWATVGAPVPELGTAVGPLSAAVSG